MNRYGYPNNNEGNNNLHSERDEQFEQRQSMIPNISRELREQDTIVKNKIADSTDSEFNQLLVYYRERINVFDNERYTWLHKIEETKHQLGEKQQLEDELQALKNSISDIQKSIQEQKVSAFSERIAFLNLSRQNADLRILDRQNRKRIAELIALTEPKKNSAVQQRTFHDNNKRNIDSKQTIKNDLNIYNQMNSKRLNDNETTRAQLETVYLPNENFNVAELENESLKAQQIQERQIFAKQLADLQRDLLERDSQSERNSIAADEQLREHENRVLGIEQKHYALNKLFFEVRRRCNDSVQRLEDDKQFLQLRNAQLNSKLDIALKTNEIENQALRELEMKKTKEYTRLFQSKVNSRTEKIEVMKEQYAQIQNMYQQKTDELENSHAQLLQRYNNLQADFENDKVVYGAEIDQLQHDLNLLQEEQRERGLVPERPQFRTHEQKLLEEQHRIQEELRLEKLQRKREKDRIYRETAEAKGQNKKKRTTNRLVSGKQQSYKQNIQRRSFTGLSDIEEMHETENRLDSINRSLRQQPAQRV